ncbi:MAG: rod shape-determining protein MreD [Clostridia bacterium]|nr:rod shape-determining protein MreD [Clostridia bacterium]
MRKTLTGIIMIFVIGTAIFLQANLLQAIPLNGTSANIGIILVASVGLICGKFIGGINGFVYGILYDIAFGRAIGIYTILYLLVGYLSGSFNKNFSKDNKVSMIFLISIITAIFETSIFLFFVLFRNYDFELQSMLFIIVKEIIYNTILILILYKFLIWFGEMINKSKNSYYLL